MRLIDLGVAQALQRAGLRASVRRPYSAPERMEGRAWGGPADIFALGAIVYEMVTGKRVAGPGVPAVSAEGVSGLDTEALAEVLGRALHADPASRFASASDLEDELRPILARGRRAVLAPKRPRSRPEGVMPLPLDPEPPVLETFDPEVTLTPTIAMAPVDLPLSHGDTEGTTDPDGYRDVLAESANTSFSTEQTPVPKPVKGPAVVPPRAISVPKAPAAAAPATPPLRMPRHQRSRSPPFPSPSSPTRWNANSRKRRQNVRSSARASPRGRPRPPSRIAARSSSRCRLPCCWVSPAALALATGPAGAPRFASPPRAAASAAARGRRPSALGERSEPPAASEASAPSSARSAPSASAASRPGEAAGRAPARAQRAPRRERSEPPPRGRRPSARRAKRGPG